ncbi:MAG TPA: hypothetical protein CFH84_11995 [Sulfurimonas sp. UBA12504]|nr:MAG TPA: hypothetical protein CFH84_11995 [Sulfurimonas sp. UBA12504]
MTQVIDTQAVNEAGLRLGDDGSYYETTYVETAKLMKTETIEVGVAKDIRLDDAPEHGTVEIQAADGSWSQMVVGETYDAQSHVRFTPDANTLDGTNNIQIGTFGNNIGTTKFSEKADVSDWGTVSNDGKSVTFTEGDLSVTTTVVENGQEQKLAAYNKSGTADGAGIGDTDNAGLSRGETMVIDIKGADVNQVVFQLDGLGAYFDANSSQATEVVIKAFDANGNEIDTQGGFRESDKTVDTYEFTTTVPVARFELTTEGGNGNFVVQNMTLSATVVDDVTFSAIAEDGTAVSVTSDINIEQGMGTTNITNLVPASDEPMTKDIRVVDVERMEAKDASLVDGVWVVVSGEEVVTPPMMDVVDSYIYPLDITAALSDTDGSESLSVTITGVPEDAILSEGVNNGDGTWTIPVAEGATSIETTITITVPADSGSFELSIRAASLESNGDDVFVVQESVTISEVLASSEHEAEVVVDDKASAPTLQMHISDAEITTTQASFAMPEIDISGAVNKGEGSNSWNEVDGTSRNDTIVAGDKFDEVNLGSGDDKLQIGDGDTNSWSVIDAASGNDTVIAGNNWEEIAMGSGNDNLVAGDNLKNIDLGEGNDRAVVGNSAANTWSIIDGGAGDDVIVAGNNFNEVALGSGNDTLNIGNFSENGWSQIEAGQGDDTMTVGYGYDFIDGESGTDTVIFKGGESEYTVGERWGETIVTHNATGSVTELRNVENIRFGGEDAQTNSTTIYQYTITLNAGVTDTDGSESLSAISLFDLPTGVTLSDANGNVISTDENGVYSVPTDANGEVSLTLTSSQELSSDVLNGITASVTSSESNGGDTSTVEANAQIEVTGTEADDTIIGTEADEYIDGGLGADTIDAGAGNDTILFDANDTAIDGGEGLDTLVFEGDMNIDLGALENPITNMETLHLGEGEQKLSLSLDDVLDVTDAENILRIDGDSADTINLDTLNTGGSGEWTLGEFKTDLETGQAYQQVTGGEGDNTVTLEISTKITIEES